MSIITQFRWYKNYTNLYYERINNTVDSIIADSDDPDYLSFDSHDLDEKSYDFMFSLSRVNSAIESYQIITDNDIVHKTDEITLVTSEIQDDIMYEFEKRNFQIKCSDNYSLDGLYFTLKRKKH